MENNNYLKKKSNERKSLNFTLLGFLLGYALAIPVLLVVKNISYIFSLITTQHLYVLLVIIAVTFLVSLVYIYKFLKKAILK